MPDGGASIWLPMLIGSGIEAGTSIYGAKKASDASKTAAAQQTQASNQALDFLRSQADRQNAMQQPFVQGGQAAMTRLGDLMAPGGGLSQAWNVPFVPPGSRSLPPSAFPVMQQANALTAGPPRPTGPVPPMVPMGATYTGPAMSLTPGRAPQPLAPGQPSIFNGPIRIGDMAPPTMGAPSIRQPFGQ